MPGFEHLAEEFLQDCADLKTVILIGRNCILAQRQQQFTSSRNRHQIASETPLGWCIMGESPPASTQRTQRRQNESGHRHQSLPQTRPRPVPRAPAFCAWCKDNNRVATHTTRHCDRFQRASIADRWEAVNRQEICTVCLIGKHSLSRCPEFRGDKSRCQQCNCFHGSGIGCRHLPAEQTRKDTAHSGTSSIKPRAI